MKKKDKLKNQYCYICGAPATSKEHVPPICLFPEEKDVGTNKFRTNLITVPSCDLHNTKKSKDDEFLMAALSGYAGNNFLGFLHTQTKVMRAMERRENFMDMFLKDPVLTTVKNSNGKSIPILRGTPDFSRLTRCFENIAHGLYYHHFKKPFDGRIFCIIDFVTYMDETAEKWKLMYRKAFELEAHELKMEGNSPQIFKYLITKPLEDGAFGMRLIFYEGAMVSVSFHPPIPSPSEVQFAERYNSSRSFIFRFKDGSEHQLDKLEPGP
ncbi:hypothetical protein [Ferruginibacter sp.]